MECCREARSLVERAGIANPPPCPEIYEVRLRGHDGVVWWLPHFGSVRGKVGFEGSLTLRNEALGEPLLQMRRRLSLPRPETCLAVFFTLPATGRLVMLPALRPMGLENPA